MKLKSHSGTKKRVKITGKRKFLLRKSSKQHLLINKSKRQKHLYPLGMRVHHGDEWKISRLLPK